MTTQNTKQSLPADFARRWILTNALGLAVGLPLWGIIQDTLADSESGENLAISLVGLLLIGGVTASLQWRLLHAHISPAGWHVIPYASVACAIGMILGFAVGGPPLGFILGFFALGLGIGLGYRTSFHSQNDRPWRRVATTTFAFGFGGIVGLAIVIIGLGDALDAAFGSGAIGFAAVLTVLGSVSGAVGGAITAPTFSNLCQQPTLSDTAPHSQVPAI